ncbi:MAG TPA: ATP-dependent DNA helicase [Aestuariivirgaceae bacterium]|nr:ATP-dependent DNA helicase [Aestuariivirgaceae bacterium]
MNHQPDETVTTTASLPIAIAVADGVGLAIRGPDGRRSTLSAAEGLTRLAAEPHVVCHAPYLIERLFHIADCDRGLVWRARAVRHYDVAELFAFACPAQFAVPTPPGLVRACGLPAADDAEGLATVVGELLARLGRTRPGRKGTAATARFLGRAKWPWAEPVLAALGETGETETEPHANGLNVWDHIEEWTDEGPKPPGSQLDIEASEALEALERFLGDEAERRPQQSAYCAEVVHAFAPRQSPLSNSILLAEAGTGLGKTLAYLAPAHVWAMRNQEPVWVSTFTKNLQRQLEQETGRIYPEPFERRRRVVIRKGRENYACLLNMQEAFARLSTLTPRGALIAALIARWARHSKDGDMIGGDFPAWIVSLMPDSSLDEDRPNTLMGLGLTDRRGECIYSACPHYRRCFIEKAQRVARKADIVVANHALVLHQAAVDHALSGEPAADAPDSGVARRLIFDEGHHVFDAADSAFSGHFTALETAELRRWIRGPEMRGRRGRSLTERILDLTRGDDAVSQLLEDAVAMADFLPSPGFMRRIQAGHAEGPAEAFFALARQQVLARAEGPSGNTVETDCHPLIARLGEEASQIAGLLADLQTPLLKLAQALLKRLDTDAAELDSSERSRIEAVARSLRRRGELLIGGWIGMLNRLLETPSPLFIEWFAIDQAETREIDVGLHSHWIDPTLPLAESVLKPADGVLITSATLKDRPPDFPEEWQNAEMRTGVVHLPYGVRRASHDSPYDYAANSRIIVVNDVNRQDMDQVAAAYRELFTAAGGGGLGLFTAISRLRAVHRRIIRPLLQAGLPLLAQHVDPLDTGTLVDMFRADRAACLLGTDAVRDGVDVPGDSLRIIVLDRVPWAQPTILERTRRKAFGGSAYQDMIVRLRLRQAFGRLIRGANDRGVFVVLDPRLASRFTTAFPPGVPLSRLGLVDAIDACAAFLSLPGGGGAAS